MRSLRRSNGSSHYSRSSGNGTCDQRIIPRREVAELLHENDRWLLFDSHNQIFDKLPPCFWGQWLDGSPLAYIRVRNYSKERDLPEDRREQQLTTNTQKKFPVVLRFFTRYASEHSLLLEVGTCIAMSRRRVYMSSVWKGSFSTLKTCAT